LKKHITEEEKYSFAASRLRISRGDVVEATYSTTDRKDATGATVEGTLLNPTGSIEDYFASAPKKNVIHVLVVVPSDESNMLHIGIDEECADQMPSGFKTVRRFNRFRGTSRA
jgi:hypothetical protein